MTNNDKAIRELLEYMARSHNEWSEESTKGDRDCEFKQGAAFAIRVMLNRAERLGLVKDVLYEDEYNYKKTLQYLVVLLLFE